MHQDLVFEYPEGAEAMSSSPKCRVQDMYSKGKFITVQGHPEFHEGIVSILVKMRKEKGIFSDEEARDALDRVGKHHDGVTVAKAFLRFLLED